MIRSLWGMFQKMMDHKYTRDTVNMFVNDARKAMEEAANQTTEFNIEQG